MIYGLKNTMYPPINKNAAKARYVLGTKTYCYTCTVDKVYKSHKGGYHLLRSQCSDNDEILHIFYTTFMLCLCNGLD